MQTHITKWLRPAITAAIDQSREPASDPPAETKETTDRQHVEASSATDEQPGLDESNTHCEAQDNGTTNQPISLPSATPSLQQARSSFTKTADRPLPASISLESCTADTLDSFKRLSSLLPLSYPNKFYVEILSDPVVGDLTLLAVAHDTATGTGFGTSTSTSRVVGGIRCRLLPDDAEHASSSQAHSIASPVPTPDDHHTRPTDNDERTNDTSRPDRPSGRMLYISTLITQPSYRNLGLASTLLSTITAVAIEKYAVKSVGAHVWVANVESRSWYAGRGFEELRVDGAYYRRLEPKGAVVVRRGVRAGDLL
jgi:hypothetical protein